MKQILHLLFGLGLLTYIALPSINTNPAFKKIGLQPLGHFPLHFQEHIKSELEEHYGSTVYLLPQQELPKSAFINVKSPRYRADSLLRYLKRIKADTLDYILGLTQFDISTTKRDHLGRVKRPESRYADWGVFGLGYKPGPAAVVSTFRLHRPPEQLLEERLLKISIHELGHNLGLAHCPNTECVMTDAVEKLSTIDGVAMELCEMCRKDLGLQDSYVP